MNFFNYVTHEENLINSYTLIFAHPVNLEKTEYQISMMRLDDSFKLNKDFICKITNKEWIILPVDLFTQKNILEELSKQINPIKKNILIFFQSLINSI